jgi:hypothetical protein
MCTSTPFIVTYCRLRLKCDGTCAETRFRLSAKRTSTFKSAGLSVQSTAGRRAVHISLQGFYCSFKPVFCSHVTLTGYPLHSLVFPSLLFPWVTVYHHISNAVYESINLYFIWMNHLWSSLTIQSKHSLRSQLPVRASTVQTKALWPAQRVQPPRRLHVILLCMTHGNV